MNEERNKQDRAKAIDDTKQPKFDALSNYFQEVLVLLKHFFDFEFPPFDDLGSTKDWDAFKKRLKLSIREDRQDKADLQENINALPAWMYAVVNDIVVELSSADKNGKEGQEPDTRHVSNLS